MTSARPRAAVWVRSDDGAWHAVDKLRGRKARRVCDGRWRRFSEGLPPGLRPKKVGPDVCASCHQTVVGGYLLAGQGAKGATNDGRL